MIGIAKQLLLTKCHGKENFIFNKMTILELGIFYLDICGIRSLLNQQWCNAFQPVSAYDMNVFWPLLSFESNEIQNIDTVVTQRGCSWLRPTRPTVFT